MRPLQSEARLIREFACEPALAFLREARVNIPFDELRRINELIREGGAGHELVPIKERSLQIFGDEKRFDVIFGTALFRPDRLDLERDLGCELIGMPLAWKRGPVGAASQPLIVIENAATWHTYCRWNAERELFSAVVSGDGIRYRAIFSPNLEAYDVSSTFVELLLRQRGPPVRQRRRNQAISSVLS